MNEYQLHSKLTTFIKKVQRTKQIIKKALDMMKKPYVAFSTGKDSTVLLDLTRTINPNIPAVYFDADAAYPESFEMLETIPNLIKFKTEPILATFRKWGILHLNIEDKTMESTVYRPIKALLAKYHFDGVFLGLRAEESYGRKKLAQTKGTLFWQKRESIWECIPLAWWTYRDIWAYIFSNNLNYNKIYDKMGALPEKERRVSYWAGETNRRGGRWVWLATMYPDLFNQLANEFPEVRLFV